MSLNAQSTKSTQLEQANETLVAIAVNVTAEDRKAAMEELKISARGTIISYLKGKGKDLDTAVKLIELFKARIDRRNNVLAA